MLGSQAACVRQCEEQCLLDMLEKADEAVACARREGLATGGPPDADLRAGCAGAAPASGTIAVERHHSGGPVSSAVEVAEQAGAAPASAAAAPLPGADSPVPVAADAGALEDREQSGGPMAGLGERAVRSGAAPAGGAALPGTRDGSAGDGGGSTDAGGGVQATTLPGPTGAAAWRTALPGPTPYRSNSAAASPKVAEEVSGQAAEQPSA